MREIQHYKNLYAKKIKKGKKTQNVQIHTNLILTFAHNFRILQLKFYDLITTV